MCYPAHSEIYIIWISKLILLHIAFEKFKTDIEVQSDIMQKMIIWREKHVFAFSEYLHFSHKTLGCCWNVYRNSLSSGWQRHQTGKTGNACCAHVAYTPVMRNIQQRYKFYGHWFLFTDTSPYTSSQCTQLQHYNNTMVINDECNLPWQLPTFLWTRDVAGSCPSVYSFSPHYVWPQFLSSSNYTIRRETMGSSKAQCERQVQTFPESFILIDIF